VNFLWKRQVSKVKDQKFERSTFTFCAYFTIIPCRCMPLTVIKWPVFGRLLGQAHPCVCLSVRPSVTNVYCGKTAERIKLIFGALLTLDHLPLCQTRVFLPRPPEGGVFKGPGFPYNGGDRQSLWHERIVCGLWSPFMNKSALNLWLLMVGHPCVAGLLLLYNDAIKVLS